MNEHHMNKVMIERYVIKLQNDEKSAATIEKYERDAQAFYAFLDGQKIVCKQTVIAYKRQICEAYSPTSVNSMLASINQFFAFEGWQDCTVKRIKEQKHSFSDPEKELTKAEYERLLKAAKRMHNEMLYLVMETICATGIRVSELRYITVEAVRRERAIVNCKGNQRIIFLPSKLSKKLVKYAKFIGASGGSVFCDKKGKPLNRTRIWAAMKALCQFADVSAKKVFPHNLRHLFARCFYEKEKVIVRLADILGHSSVNTTRIYTMESGLVHARQVARLGLVI